MKEFAFLQTVRARLTLWNVLTLALVLLVLGGLLRVSVERNLMDSIDKDLSGRARRSQEFWNYLAQKRSDGGWPEPPDTRHDKSEGRNNDKKMPPPPHPPEDMGAPSQWHAPVVEKIYDAQGKRLFGPKTEPPLDTSTLADAAGGREHYSTVRISGEAVRVYSVPLQAQGKNWGVVQEGYSLAEVERALRNLNRTLLALTPFALLAAGAGGLFLTGRMLRPVREITQAAGQIEARDLSQRLAVRGQDEFSELSATFNGMLGRLEQSFAQQQRFTADASHELRTPLTVIKANTSLALSRNDLSATHRKAMESVDKAAGVMNRVVQDLLLLARSDAGQLELPLRPIRLAEALETAILCVSPEGGAPITNLAPDSRLLVQGDASHLTRLFTNLLENAVRATPADGTITLSAVQEGASVIVTVADTGCGIPPEHPAPCLRTLLPGG